MENVTNFVVGDPARNQNTFLSSTFGINATTSNFTVLHNTFNLNNGKSHAIYAKGTGDRKIVNTLVVGGLNPNELNTFLNTGYGVYTNGVEQVITLSNNFDFCTHSISLNKVLVSTSSFNMIDNFYNGIEIYNATLPDPVDLTTGVNNIVEHNDFNTRYVYGTTLLQYGNTALDVRNDVQSYVPVQAKTNTILNSRVGIHFLNSNRSLATNDNTYEAFIPFDQSTDYHYGIWVQNSNAVRLENNHITWSGAFVNGAGNADVLGNQKAISIDRSFKCILQENSIHNFAAGINIFDDCSNDNLYCNLMDNCYHGVFLDDQNPNNRMTDQGIAVFTGSIYEHDLSTSWKNRWVSNANTDNKVDGYFNGTPFNWEYDDVINDPEYSPIPSNTFFVAQPCSLNKPDCTTPTSFMDDEIRKEAFGRAVGDSSLTDVDSLEYAHNDNAVFYKQVKDNPGYLNLGYPTDVLYQLKYNLLMQSNIGKFEDAKASLSTKELQEALNKLNSMQGLNSIDENNKYITKLLALGYDPDLDLDSDTIASVTSIALLHPFYGGEAVYMARAILRIDVHDQLPQYRKASRPKPVKSFLNSIIAYPNPSSNAMTLYSNQPFQKSDIRIFNSVGEQVKFMNLPDEEVICVLSLDQLPSGIYSYQIYTANTLIKNDKLVIIK